jgi:hypothetical protein
VDLVFTISLKRNTLYRQLSTSCTADYPIFGSCVDGSPLARVFLMFCPSVGAAMCAACLCGTHRPLAIMPSAETGPYQKHGLEAP